jgi:DNA-binding NtrC family response regulator
MRPRVLLIDDDPIDLKALQLLIEDWEMEVSPARSGADALARLRDSVFDLVVSDVCMPGMSGEDVVKAVRDTHPDLPVVLITGQGDVRSAVRAMKLGASDYVLKPPDEEELRVAVDRALEHGRLRRENAFLQAQLSVDGTYGERLIGRSPAMLAVFDLINRVARTDTTVLIAGETGTGKELVAQTIHFRSARAGHPLVALNCASLNANLIESELFGHERGAFTGAVAARRGRFEEAEGGTLFLDEITETTPEFQAKLLRVLQEGEFQRVGGNARIRSNLRLIAASNRSLSDAVREGRFREDLYYRLNVIPIEVPPLRERGDDILLLAMHFLQVYAKRYDCGVTGFAPEALAWLRGQPWKGNVRELQHAVERAVVLARGTALTVEDLSRPERAAPRSAADATLESVLERRTREYLVEVLDRTGWSKQRAAAILDVDRVTLYRMLRKFSLERD